MRRVVVAVLLLAIAAVGAQAQSLRGSSHSLSVQNRMARAHDFTYIRSSAQVRDFVHKKLLVELHGNADLALAAVSHPYARPEVADFVVRLAAQYRAACGERLVVTSLTRPVSRQPRNASRRSVHPTGMAVDVRVGHSYACRRWMTKTLLTLEREGVVEATRERHPPHYHIAVSPTKYRVYAATLEDEPATRLASSPGQPEELRYRVRRGDSLWTIARAYGIDVDTLKEVNEIRGSEIYPGQVLTVPTGH